MFSLSVETGNAAFADPATGEPSEICEEMETERILQDVLRKISNGERNGSCIDINGNKVGSWKFS